MIYIVIMILIIILLLNSNKENFLYAAKWDPRYVVDTHYPPFRVFSSTPQEKFYATWCGDCFMELKKCQNRIKILENENKILKKN